MDPRILTIQKALRAKGFKGKDGKQLTLDGIDGANTQYAIVQFKRSIGFWPRPYVGPSTYAKLVGGQPKPASKPDSKKYSDVPWLQELYAMLGTHESKDNKELREWLKSDGATVGDPDDIPWCGDAVQTALLRWNNKTEVPKNPYAAINWLKVGEECKPFVGAIVIFWRGSPTGWKGHIGFIVGQSAANWYVLGGNQGDSVTITPIAKNRVRDGGIRCPKGWSGPREEPPTMSGGTVSTNEA